MTLDELLRTAETRHLTFEDVESYCTKSELEPRAALDTVSRVVASRYTDGAVSYGFGDVVMNSIFAYGTQCDVMSDFTFSVYLAFDAGEFYPDEIREPSPEERFTRPRIAAILASDGLAKSQSLTDTK